MAGDVLDMVIGVTIVVCTLGLITFLVLWSRKRIERIARSGFGSAREIMKDEQHGR